MLRCFLLTDETGLYLAFGKDAVEAATFLVEQIGGDANLNRFSVGGSWDATPGNVIPVSSWWPYFTASPSAKHRSQ